eukprot:6627973-Prymnesium_polylepis.1
MRGAGLSGICQRETGQAGAIRYDTGEERRGERSRRSKGVRAGCHRRAGGKRNHVRRQPTVHVHWQGVEAAAARCLVRGGWEGLCGARARSSSRHDVAHAQAHVQDKSTCRQRGDFAGLHKENVDTLAADRDGYDLEAQGGTNG